MPSLWMVRAGRNGVYAQRFLEGGYVGIGFSHDLGPIPPGSSREDLTAQLRKLNPGRKTGRLINAAGQLFRFHFEMQVGDQVVSYDPSQRRYQLGVIQSGVEHHADPEEPLPYQRRVEWKKRVARPSLTTATRNTLGSVLTIFKPNESTAADLRANAVPLDAPDELVPEPVSPPPGEEPVDVDELRESLVERASELIEDLIASLDPDQMEELVAGILRAMGYKARVSPKGPDRGVDVFASPDGLGLEEPRIFVEVKHQSKPMGSSQLRAFLGGRQSGDKCVFVSTGGFTKEAKYEADRSNVPLSLVDLPELRELLIEHYKSADLETRQLVPLRRLYWPVAIDD